MKLKYKKIILLVTMCTMCIGLVTLFISTPSANSSTKVEGVDAAASQPDDKEAATPGAASSPAPTATALSGSFTLEWESHPEINELVEKYMNASAQCDMDALSGLVNDISYIDEEMLRLQYEYVEGFENIECYISKTPEEGTYLVYVSSDTRIKDVTTGAPGLSYLYVKMKEDGSVLIYRGEISEAVQSFAKNAEASQQVKKLVDTVNKNLEEKLTSDAKLKQFYENLENPVSE